ncbi:AfsR/SARP family transcriptional regulator [Microlunatus phosphovorus]|uniref:AfsR/SARP family transcriptional regulator n=1 Tax=Microlunatus phosphovorus TaxID=29405 RepID=UPI000308DFA6|nr:BTAD domain-containing putative transcriptional regulator [Microlunatus phosphovorus]
MSKLQLDLCLLGAPTLSSSAGQLPVSPSALTLCAYLALAPGYERSREVAAAHLYADSPVPAARRRLSTAIWRLRTEVRDIAGVDLVTTAARNRVGLSSAVQVSVDATTFEQLVSSALQRPPADLTRADANQLASAVDLHRGCLIEACDDEWVLADRNRLENLYLSALDHLIVFHGAQGSPSAVSRFGELALALEPLREDIHRHLMTAYAINGRDDLVERQFERCRRTLLEELGADPMPETIALYSRLRCPDRTAAAPPLAALVADLERARRDVGRLAAIVERALDHLRHLA